MNNPGTIILTLGSILLAGIAIDALAKRIHLPRVTLLIIIGVLIGPSFFNLIPAQVINDWYPTLTKMSVSMIAFLIGSKLASSLAKELQLNVLLIACSVAVLTTLFVFTLLYFTNIGYSIALLLAGISTATSPTTTFDVVEESKINNKFTDLLLSVTAINSAFCLVIFTLTLTLVKYAHGENPHLINSIFAFIREIGGALLLGTTLGFLASQITGKVRSEQATMTEALGIVLLSCGCALLLKVSFILTLIIVGLIIGRYGRHHRRAFHAIEDIEWPFMVIFFILAGSMFHINMVIGAGVVGTAYIFSRIIGRIISAWIGVSMTQLDGQIRRWLGLAMSPQGGVAIGLSLIAIQAFPEYKETILTVVLGSTVFLEIVGPIFMRVALRKVQ